MEYKITKVQKYGKGIYMSEKIGVQRYYLVYLHVFADPDKKTYYKLHFICMFDNEDLFEYYDDKDTVTDDEIKAYRDEIVWSCAESICYPKNINDIIDNCNQTIKRYA